MSDAQARDMALTQLDALLTLAESGPLDSASCLRVGELCSLAPGRMRKVVATLSRQRDAASVEALLSLPAGTSGVIEGLYGALRQGVSRIGGEGARSARMLALEFRSSTSRSFPQLLTRATAAFGSELERIRVGDKLYYRYCLLELEPSAPTLGARARKVEFDLIALHRDLARLRGVSVWLNGWQFDEHSKVRPASRVALLRAWFDWAREQDPQAPPGETLH